MSTIQANAILDASGGNTTTINGVTPNTDTVRGRNLIINGAMQVAQRSTSAVTATNGGYTTVDRWKTWEGTDGTFTTEQSTDAPDGFATSLKCQVTSADTSISSNQYVQLVQNIEGLNLQSLAYGTSSAKTITVSFWVKSNKTGIYAMTFVKDACSGTRYQYPKEYTINAANTWEKKEITISPSSLIQATPAAIWNSNQNAVDLYFNLALGTAYNGGTDGLWEDVSGGYHYSTTNLVNWMDSTSNNFYITGVKLEVGSVATEFDHRSYGEDLALCQRYYETDMPEGGSDTRYSMNMNTTSSHYTQESFQVTKRAVPTITVNQTYNDDLTVAVSTGTTSRHHAGFALSNGGTINARALAEFNWTADAEL